MACLYHTVSSLLARSQSVWIVWAVNCFLIATLYNIILSCKFNHLSNGYYEQYWPPAKGSSETYGNYGVQLTSLKKTNDYIVRKMDISESQSRMSVSQSKFSVTHIQYLKWMEDSVPMITSPVLEIANLVQSIQMGSGNKPIVVMCKYGAIQLVHYYMYNYIFIMVLHNNYYREPQWDLQVTVSGFCKLGQLSLSFISAWVLNVDNYTKSYPPLIV